jgi:hypothetical protein
MVISSPYAGNRGGIQMGFRIYHNAAQQAVARDRPSGWFLRFWVFGVAAREPGRWAASLVHRKAK